MGQRTSRIEKQLLLIVSLLSLLLLPASGSCTQRPWPLWAAYSARFIDAQGRVIDPQGAGRTTSEGQSYAMFFALVDNDRATFDRLLNWTQTNLANGDLGAHLPSWLWGRNPSGEWKTLDSNSASDADIWMTYSLLEAGRLWQVPGYASVGRRMLTQIAKSEVAELPGFGPMLLPGPTGFEHDRAPKLQSWTLNPSYVPLFIFQRLAAVDTTGPWRQIALGIPRLLEKSSRHGFAMDWVEYLPGDGFHPALAHPAPPQPGKQAEAPCGSYDAIRVYLWAGMLDGSGKTRARMLNAVPGMSEYLANHDAPPERVSDQGVPLAQNGPVGFSAAVLPYLMALPGPARLSERQTARLSAEKDPTTGLY